MERKDTSTHSSLLFSSLLPLLFLLLLVCEEVFFFHCFDCLFIDRKEMRRLREKEWRQ